MPTLNYTDISNNDDYVYEDDIVALIEELEDRHVECDCSPKPELGIIHYPFCALFDEERMADALEPEEELHLHQLRELLSELEYCAGDFGYGANLIRDSYFRDYAEQFADDIGAINSENSWPAYCIDWDIS